MRFDPNDVVSADDDAFVGAARYASGAPVMAGAPNAAVAYPLYGLGQAPGAPAPAAPPLLQRMKGPAIGFVLGGLVVGGLWFYFGHWLPLKQRAAGRTRRAA